MRRRFAVVFLLGSLVLGANPLAVHAAGFISQTSSSSGGSSVDTIDTSGFPTVTATLTLPVAARMSIEAGAHVTVTENGVPVTSTSRSTTTTRPEVVIIIDRSKSMGNSTFSAIRDASTAFVNGLPVEIPVAVVSFNARVTVDARRTTDRQSITSAINQLRPGGGTALYDAIITGSKQFSRTASERLMIVVSDGGDSNSKRPLPSALKAATGVDTYFLEISRSLTHHRTLQYLGGEDHVFTATNPSDIDRGFRSATGRITSQVVITFQSRAERGTTNAVMISFVHQGQRISAQSTFDSPMVVKTRQSNVFTKSSTLVIILGLVILFYGLTTTVFAVLATQGRSVRTRLTPTSPADRAPTGVSAIDRLGRRISRMLATTSRLERLMQDIDDANISSSPARFLMMNGLAAVAVAIVIGAFSNPLLALFGFLVTLFVERKRLSSRVAKRRTEFIAQLPDTLQMLSSMLRSGYGLVQALDTVASEATEPTRGWLGQVMLEVRAGRDLVNSLQALATDIDSLDFDWVVAGIEISREVGGDLAKTLDTVSGTIRERDELRAHINALTAEGRLSAYVMLVLPPAVAVISLLINPEFGSLLFKSSGIPMMFGAGVLMVIGFAWMRKIIAKVA